MERSISTYEKIKEKMHKRKSIQIKSTKVVTKPVIEMNSHNERSIQINVHILAQTLCSTTTKYCEGKSSSKNLRRYG